MQTIKKSTLSVSSYNWGLRQMGSSGFTKTSFSTFAKVNKPQDQQDIISQKLIFVGS
jgi:hypothetical protein